MESDTQESPATIHSLPPELLSDILSHLFTTDEIHLDSLKHASLVSRAWRDPAQTLVWEAGAELRSSEDVERFIRTSSSRRSGPREMAIHDYEDAGQLKRLFAVCGSLRWLMVAVGHKNFDATVLTVPQLSNLRTFIVQAPLSRPPPDLTFPFSLHTLVLDDLTFGSSHLGTLLTAFQPSADAPITLRSIALPGFSSNAHKSVAKALAPFMPHLSHLGLAIEPHVTPSIVACYIPALHAATALNSLECTSLPRLLLANLPPSLTVLATPEDADNLDGKALLTALRALPMLKKLYFHTTEEEFRQEVEGGDTLVEEVRARGVKWWFAGREDE